MTILNGAKLPGFLKKPVTWILVLNSLLFLLGINWGLPSSESWLSDSLAPFHPLLGLSQGFSFGYLNKYPLVHQLLLAILNLPVVIIAFINSNPMEGLQLSKFLLLIRSDQYATALILTDRLVSVFMGVGTVYGMYRCARLLFNERVAVFTALLLSFNGVLNFYSHVAKVEVPYIFWGVWGMYMLIKAVKYEQMRDYVYLALFSCLSYGTKDQGYALFVLPFIFYLAVYRVVYREPGRSVASTLFRRNFLVFMTAFIVISLITQNIFFNLEGFIYRFRILTGWNSQRSISYTMDALGIWALLKDSTVQVIDSAMGLPVFLLCMAGSVVFIAVRFRERKEFLLESVFLVGALSVYLFFVQIIRQDNVRHNLPQTIYLTVYGGFLLDYLGSRLQGKMRQAAVAVLVLLCAYSFYFTFSVNMNFINDMRYDVEKWMQRNIPEKSKIEYYSYIHYLPRFPRNTYSYRVTNNGMDIEKRRPDYIVLTSHYYPRYFGGTENIVVDGRIQNTPKAIKRRTTTDMGPFLEDLLAEKLAYRQVARFEQENTWYRRVGYARISPRHVLVFRRVENKGLTDREDNK